MSECATKRRKLSYSHHLACFESLTTGFEVDGKREGRVSDAARKRRSLDSCLTLHEDESRSCRSKILFEQNQNIEVSIGDGKLGNNRPSKRMSVSYADSIILRATTKSQVSHTAQEGYLAIFDSDKVRPSHEIQVKTITVDYTRSKKKESVDSLCKNPTKKLDNVVVALFRLLAAEHEMKKQTYKFDFRILCSVIQQYNGELIISDSVNNFSYELMLGNQIIRQNPICLTKFIFQVGVALHSSGYVRDAFLLYEELLNQLARISSISSCLRSPSIYLEAAKRFIQGHEATFAERLRETSLQVFVYFYPRMACTLNLLGKLHEEINDVTTAADYFNAGIKVDEALLFIYYTSMIESFMNVASLLCRRGSYQAALEKYIQIHFLQLQLYGAHSIQVAASLSMVALMQYRLKQYSSSYELYQAAFTIQRHFLGDDNITTASTLNSIGLCCFHLRLLSYAKQFFIRSLQIRQKILGADHEDLAIIWYNIATLCIETGQDIEAIKYYKESLRIEQLSFDIEKCEGAILTMQNLGYIYQQSGELDEACTYFRLALDLQKQKYGEKSNVVGRLYNLLGNIHLQKAEVKEMMEYYIQAARIHQEVQTENATMVISGFTFYSLSKSHPQCAKSA